MLDISEVGMITTRAVDTLLGLLGMLRWQAESEAKPSLVVTAQIGLGNVLELKEAIEFELKALAEMEDRQIADQNK